MVTFRAGLTAVPRQQDGIITVVVRAVLLDVLTVYFPKHLPTTTLLLQTPKKHTVGTFVSTATNYSLQISLYVRCVCVCKTYRFTVALDTVHDAEGLPQVRVPCVLQGIKLTSE